jgi:hypothetical protein
MDVYGTLLEILGLAVGKCLIMRQRAIKASRCAFLINWIIREINISIPPG